MQCTALSTVFTWHGLTWHVREREDALIEAISEQVLLELLQDGHAHTEGEGGIPQQQCVPQVKDFVQGQNVCGGSTSEHTMTVPSESS